MATCPELAAISPEVAQQIVYDVKYAGYIQRSCSRSSANSGWPANGSRPTSTTTSSVICAPKRARNWPEIRPVSVDQASRISGITPADIALLLTYLESRTRVAR